MIKTYNSASSIPSSTTGMTAGKLGASIIDQVRSYQNDSNVEKYLRYGLAQVNAANATAIQQANLTNNFNAAEAQKQRDWEEKMSNTSYTRAVSDLRNAGLNPVLAYQNGGASTPSGSAASGQKANIESAASLYGSIIQSMINQNTQLETAKINADATKYASDNQVKASISNAELNAKVDELTTRMNNEQSNTNSQRSTYNADIMKLIALAAGYTVAKTKLKTSSNYLFSKLLG